MFMQRIELPTAATTPAPPPMSVSRVISVSMIGAGFIAVMAVVMLIYWAAVSLWIGTFAVAHGSARLARTMRDISRYTGTSLVGA